MIDSHDDVKLKVAGEAGRRGDDHRAPEPRDADRDAIIARRNAFIAIALSSLTALLGASCTGPTPCLECGPKWCGTDSGAMADADAAGFDSGVQDAGTDARTDGGTDGGDGG